MCPISASVRVKLKRVGILILLIFMLCPLNEQIPDWCEATLADDSHAVFVREDLTDFFQLRFGHDAFLKLFDRKKNSGGTRHPHRFEKTRRQDVCQFQIEAKKRRFSAAVIPSYAATRRATLSFFLLVFGFFASASTSTKMLSRILSVRFCSAVPRPNVQPR